MLNLKHGPGVYEIRYWPAPQFLSMCNGYKMEEQHPSGKHRPCRWGFLVAVLMVCFVSETLAWGHSAELQQKAKLQFDPKHETGKLGH